MNFAERLAAVRSAMAAQDLAALLVPHSDEHLAEYLPASAERLAWLTGFTGSAGIAVVWRDRAAAWSDGRYVLQLATETDPALWERLHLTEIPPETYVAKHTAPDARIGYDPWLISEISVQRYRAAGLNMVGVDPNPVDLAWKDRPAPPIAPALPHELEYAGATSAEKRARIAAQLVADKQHAAILTDPASIAWLLNIRGSDVDCTPFALGFSIAHADGAVELFMAPEKLPPATREFLGNEVSTADRGALPQALASLRGKTVRVDAEGAPAWFQQRLEAEGAIVIRGQDPCLLPKACKNAVEQQGARNAQARDAVALCRFLHWLATAAGHETELSAGQRLLEFRKEIEGFRGPSFPSITGAGEHGAIIHYRATPETNREIRPDEIFLIDSGGQYPDGTTDVTRTIWTGPGTPPAELRDRFTRVLKGHIAIATLVFPEGVAGVRLDAFARAPLWQAGLDYDHGTGHGVGSFLSVHEGPVSISTVLKPATLAEGMILSNEPGFYLPGHYGIRLENLLLVRAADIAGSTRRFLRFETLTLAPFDRILIDAALLTAAERQWLDAYHTRILTEIGPHFPPPAAAWLAAACAPLEKAAK